MFALAYVSQAAVPFDDAALAALAEKASTKNQRRKVTGYLNYHSERHTFFQFLEGPEQPVIALMEAISKDDRHRLINVVHLGELESRLFPKWNMRYLNTKYYRAIGMEDVLDDVFEGILVSMSEKVFDRETIVSTVLRIARQIAARKTA